MTHPNITSRRTVTLAWPPGGAEGVPLTEVIDVFEAWVAEARARGCPDTARVGPAGDRQLNNPGLMVMWDASDDTPTEDK